MTWPVEPMSREDLKKMMDEEKEQKLIASGGEIDHSGEPVAAVTVLPEQMPLAFQGASTLRLTEEQKKILLEPFPDEVHDIRSHDGLVYVSHIYYRDKLTAAFGPGGWALVPVGDVKTDYRTNADGHILLDGVTKKPIPKAVGRAYQLWIQGCYVSETWGAADLVGGNQNMNKFDTLEAMKSYALVRLCKDLGMGSECWKKPWTEDWKRKYTVGNKIKPDAFKKG